MKSEDVMKKGEEFERALLDRVWTNYLSYCRRNGYTPQLIKTEGFVDYNKYGIYAVYRNNARGLEGDWLYNPRTGKVRLERIKGHFTEAELKEFSHPLPVREVYTR